MTTQRLSVEPVADSAGLHSRTRLFLGMLFIVLLGELSAVSYILVATALPKISQYYHETTQISWTMTVVSLTSGVLVGVTGKLADLRGKRLILVGLVTVSTVGCVISALAPDYGVFLVGRALQGCLYLVPAMGFSLVRDVFPKKYVALGASLAFTGSGLVSIFGPFLAGWLEGAFGVLSVFWFAGIFQVVCLVGLVLTVPESPVRVRARLDWVGAALLGLGSVSLVYAIGQGSSWGWTSVSFLGLTAAGIAFFVGWLAWDSRFSDPLIAIALLRTSRMKSTLLLTFLAFCTMGPIGAILPNLLQTPRGVGGNYGFGIDAYGVARYSIAMGLLTALGGFLVGTQAQRWGIRGPMIFGVACLGGAAAGFATLPSSPALMITLMGLMGLGTGITSACIPNLMLQSVPPAVQGISATTQVTASNLGSVVTTQLAFAILTQHVVSGSTFAYSAHGYTLAFTIAAGCAVIALIGCVLMPHGRRRDVLNSTVGYEEVAAA